MLPSCLVRFVLGIHMHWLFTFLGLLLRTHFDGSRCFAWILCLTWLPLCRSCSDEPAPGLTELPNYTMNVNEAIDADVRKENLHAIVERPVAALNGLGERATTMFSEMNVTTIRDLGEWSLYKKALAIKTLADVEVEGARASPCILNIDEAVVEAYEAKSFKEILDAPVTALQGVGESAAEALAIHHVDTVRKLADFKYCAWASALLTLSASENTKSAAEKTQETLLKRLE